MNKRNLDKLTFYKFTQFFTDRDIVKICVSLLIDEECNDFFDNRKIITNNYRNKSEDWKRI